MNELYQVVYLTPVWIWFDLIHKNLFVKDREISLFRLVKGCLPSSVIQMVYDMDHDIIKRTQLAKRPPHSVLTSIIHPPEPLSYTDYITL